MIRAEITIIDSELIKDLLKNSSFPFIPEKGDVYNLLLQIEKDLKENITTAYYEIRGIDKYRFKMYEINHYVAEQWINKKGLKLDFK